MKHSAARAAGPGQGDLFDAVPADGDVVCGIDEAGRGPLAGPVAAAAVILPAGFAGGLLADSKALTAKARDVAFDIIVRNAWWSVDWAWPDEIDDLNILGATFLAMRRAWARLRSMLDDDRPDRLAGGAPGVQAASIFDPAVTVVTRAGTGGRPSGTTPDGHSGDNRKMSLPVLIIIDGNRLPDLGLTGGARVATMVKADAKVRAVMAASIVAKVCRDRLMERYAAMYPAYGYDRHKGYPTEDHRATCRRLGPSPIQRMSFDYSKE